MQSLEIAIFIILALSISITILLSMKISKQKSKIQDLNEILEIKNTTISNYEASRIAVKDVIENFFAIDKVINLVNQGKSRKDISKILDISIEKIELIIKLSKLRDNYKN